MSAKGSIQLKQQAEKLLGWIREAAPFSAPQLADLAYTLQTGREAMEERLAIEVSSFPQLEEKLRKFTHGEQPIANLYRGTIREPNGVIGVMGTDDDLAAILDDWMDKQKYGKLLDLWVRGLSFDWNKLYPKENGNAYHPHRISLPTYPFLRKRCWFKQSAETLGGEPDAKEASRQTAALPPQAIMLQEQWEESPAVSRSAPCQHVAILYSPETQEIAAGLTQQLAYSALINVHDADAFGPDPLQSVKWKNFDGFVDLVGCGRNPVESLDWVQWLQHLIEHGRKEGIRLLGVTAQLTGFQNNAVNLTGASRTGLYRMLQSEYSHVVSRHVDVEDTEVAVLVQQILDELSFEDEESAICYRGEKRYRPVLQEIAAELSRESAPLPGDSVVWITGGTRGLGYLCAQHLVKHYGVKRLVLTGQEELPPRVSWESYLPQDTGLAQKIKNVLALEAQGAAVEVLAVPLADKNTLAKNVARIKDIWGPITGVIHCAGIGDRENPAFIKKSIAGIQSVLNPKVKGLDNLYECLREEPLAFFVLFSSVSALVPSLGAGQAAYAMANAYMDHFAEAKWDSSKVISIQWPNWKETGMGEVKTKAYHQTGLLSLTDAEGLQSLDLILREKIGPVILPAWVDRAVWEPEKLLRYARPAKSVTARRDTIEKVRTATSDTSSELLDDTVRQWLTELFTQELKLESADLKPDKPFQDYGIDSILITQLLHPIQQTIQRDIDPSILYEYATIQSFAHWLVETFPYHLSRIFSPAKEIHLALATENRSEEIVRPSPQTSLAIEKAPSRHTIGVDIAVVGMTCRFPGAPDLDAYWKLLTEGRSAIRTVPPERWNSVTCYAAGLLEDPYYFDPKFFLLPENDARAMDPQALIVLEETLKLFYQAGYTLEEIKGKPIGVYLGGRSKHAPGTDQLKSARNPIVAVGQNYLSANVSQFFDLRGPGVVVDTACSSALVGMNMAIQALQNGEIESAVVGGVSLLNSVETHELFQQRGLLNSGNQFHIFDRRAGGIVLGEGVGMVLLKTVDQAMKDGDRIYATIQSVAVNNDGRTAGPATPNIEAQKEVMRRALAKAGKKPEEIGYIEVNGSGSEVTDLIEIKAINAVYRSSSSAPCGLGSVKPNIGHPLCAEGIASFIKVVLMLHHRQIVPFLSGQQPMKYFDIVASPFHFTDALRAWPAAPKVAAVNCFADGGTNAHVILEAWTGDSGEKLRREPLIVPALHRQNLRSDEIRLTFHDGNDYSSVVPDNAVLQSVWETFE